MLFNVGMRAVFATVVTLLVLAGCAGGSTYRNDLADEIGQQMASTLGPALVAARHDPRGAREVWSSVDAAVEDASGIVGVALGTQSDGSSTSGGGYADVSVRLIVVPDQAELAFCMDFAMASTGEVIARPADGDVSTSCTGTADTSLRRR